MTLRHAAGILVMVGISAVLCCDSGDDIFVVRVDRIEAPLSVTPGTPFEVKLHGTIGPNLCSFLEQIVSERTTQQLELTVYGRRKRGPQICPEARSLLRGEVVVVRPPFAGPFRIVVHQPDDTTLESLVQVQ